MALLSWLPLAGDAAGLHASGAEHGIVKASDAQRLLDLVEAEVAFEQRRQALLNEAKAQAEAELAKARLEAQMLLAKAEERVAQACDAARQQAMEQAVNEWHERTAAAASASAERTRAMHERMAGVVVTAVERIVSGADREALLRRALEEVQVLARDATALVMRVSRDDEDTAQAVVAALPQIEGLAVSVAVDVAMPSGGCIFETDAGTLDAGLSTQLQALRAAVERAARRAATGETP